MTLATIQSQLDRMEQYLRLKLEQRDWHGVADAAMDIRELEAQKKLLLELNMSDGYVEGQIVGWDIKPDGISDKEWAIWLSYKRVIDDARDKAKASWGNDPVTGEPNFEKTLRQIEYYFGLHDNVEWYADPDGTWLPIPKDGYGA